MLRWEQLILFGAGHPAPPAAICEAAPLLCSLQHTLYGPDLSGWPAAGEIKERITLSTLAALSFDKLASYYKRKLYSCRC